MSLNTSPEAVKEDSSSESNLQLFLKIFPATLASTLILMSANVVNAIMAAKISTLAMASLALAGSVIWPLNSLGVGFLSVIQSKIGYKYGKGEVQQVGAIHRQSYYAMAIVCLIIIVAIILIAQLLELFNVDQEIVAIAKPYMYLNIINVPLIMFITHIRNINSIVAYTLPTLYASIANIVLLVPLNYLFMFGIIPGVDVNPKLSALTTTSNALISLVIFFYFFNRKEKIYGPLELFTSIFDKVDWAFLKDTIKVGLPISLQYYLENCFYGIITLFIAHLGTEVVAAHEAAMITYGVTYGIALSASGALVTITSRRLGERKRQKAHQALINIMIFIFIANCFTAWGVIEFRDFIATEITNGTAEVIALASNLLIFLAFSNLFDSMYTCLLGYLVPYRDTRFTMITTLIVSWGIYMPLASIFAFTNWFYFGNYGIYSFWTAFILIAITCAIIFAMRAYYWSHHDHDKLYARLSKNDI